VSSGAYESVLTSPAFAERPAASGLSADTFFAGPDGQTWYLGGAMKKVEKVENGVPQVTEAVFAVIFEASASTPAVRFQFPTPLGQPYQPTHAVTGPEGEIWMTDPSAGGLDRWNPSTGELATFAMPIGSAGPVSILAGPNSRLWSADMVTGALGEIVPGVEEPTLSEVALPGGSGFGHFNNTEPLGLAVGPEGDVWVAAHNDASIDRVAPSGAVQRYPIPQLTGSNLPEVGRPEPAYPAVGPEGAVWFTDPGDNAIGRVLGGQVSEYPIPATRDVDPESIVTVGGELWFTEALFAGLGSVNPAAPAGALPAVTLPVLATVSSAQVAAMLRVTGRSARTPALLRTGGYTTTVKLPGAGTAAITWTHKGSLVATGHVTLAAAGSRRVKIALTATGRRLLRKGKKALPVTAAGAVTLSGGSPVTASKALALSR
jgi:virginiamycin B lyase